jgi:hypothetical protein
MSLMDDIRRKIKARQYEFSKHAVDQTFIRKISVTELEEAVSNRSEVIEDYPEDKYGPSCLILGFTFRGLSSAYTMQLPYEAIAENHYCV